MATPDAATRRARALAAAKQSSTLVQIRQGSWQAAHLLAVVQTFHIVCTQREACGGRRRLRHALAKVLPEDVAAARRTARPKARCHLHWLSKKCSASAAAAEERDRRLVAEFPARYTTYN